MRVRILSRRARMERLHRMCGPVLELDLQGHLSSTGFLSAGDYAVVRGAVRRGWIVGVYVVEGVEERRPELNRGALTDGKVLVGGHVEVLQAGSQDGAVADVSVIA